MGTKSCHTSTHIVMDTETGEIVSELQIGKQARAKYCFPGGFAFMGLVYISKLAKLKLPADGYRLALLIMSYANYGGLCNRNNSQYCEELGISDPARVSRLKTKLHTAGVIHKLGPHLVLVNPVYCFRGSASEQHKALEHWSSVRGLRAVIGVKSKAA